MEKRVHKYLSVEEIKRLMKEIDKGSTYPERDKLYVWLSYRHGLRVSEATGLRWLDVNFEENRIFIHRAKGSVSGIHPLEKEDRGYLLSWKRKTEYQNPRHYIFMSQRGNVLSRTGCFVMMKRYGEKAGIEHCHPHQLRHSCGLAMAKANIPTLKIQHWLGHKSINNTVIYTNEAGLEFDNLQKWW